MTNPSKVFDPRISILEAENRFLLSLLNSFWTGDVPENASLDHLVLAKAGRLRLQEMSKKPVLLTGGVGNGSN